MRWGRVTAGNANLIIQNKRRWETQFASSYVEIGEELELYLDSS
jgi:hypothetical protein